ncbi:DUF4132 domain-containing protein [Actinomadura rudentiformis]|uniref:DUF4132 domain-containing protein n=1 Tax=Actinomadura rudentiformis TaxID=359158 RepID=A0A6H9YRN0_9ACTN|nr:DUF4132 domain-containing protein [Actinomadura rudentiformis]KAB2344403.1 DUF4132 domain-containing protein [Actinomadura rudentiformis]
MIDPRFHDENALVLPETWLKRLHPRRGGAVITGITPDRRAPGVVRERVRQADEHLESTLAHPGSDATLVRKARGHLAGKADPTGAAVVTAILLAQPGRNRQREDECRQHVDAWAVEHGVAFAACAFAELSGIVTAWNGWDRQGDVRDLEVRYRQPGEHLDRWWARSSVARRMRALLAVAEEEEYGDAVRRLAGHRNTDLQRVVVSYLVPTEGDWVDECCAAPPTGVHESRIRWMLWCALGRPEQIALLGPWAWLTRDAGSLLEVLVSLAEGVGPEALTPPLVEAIDRTSATHDLKVHLEVLAAMPTDEAFTALVSRIEWKHVQPFLLEAMGRFPVRALRLLVPEASGTSKTAVAISDLLTGHLLAHPELRASLPGLSDDVRAVVERLTKESERMAEAPVTALPSLLVEPPWSREGEAKEPVVVTGLSAPSEPALAWADGEQQEWADVAVRPGLPSSAGWEADVQTFLDGKMTLWLEPQLFIHGPEELVRPLLAGWQSQQLWHADRWVKPLAARFGLAAFPHALAAAEKNPTGNGALLLPFLDVRAAEMMADWLARRKSARPIAMAWFGRHGAAAARLLIPAALGKPGRQQRAAEGALLMLAARSGSEQILQVASEYGEQAAAAIETLLDIDPLSLLPDKIPSVGGWADPALLPQIVLTNGAGALPPDATRHFLTMLAMSKPSEVYAGVAAVKEVCTPESLAAFSWGLFQRWQMAGAPSPDGWALSQLGWLGDDETVRRLTPLIRAWPGEGGHKKAVAGLDALAEIGTDVALMHLHGIAQKVKFKGLKTKAQEKIKEVAAGLGLSPEQLADRLVPDFGLDHDGAMTLDYGPRSFRVGFDEQLKPYVTDEDGKPRKALPKPGAKDDPDLAPASYKAFSTLKKDVRTVAADQISRLESAMVTRRRWSATEFHDFFATHPLLWHIARRVVWLCEDGGKSTAFRLAEDRTLADVADDVLTLPESAQIGIAHPLDLGEDVDAWSESFADYEILQPFPQLGRSVHALTDEERASGRLTRFEGLTVPFGKVLGLVKRGWERGTPLDAGIEPWISRQVSADRHVVIDLDPGLAVGMLDEFPEQKLTYVWLSSRPDDYYPREGTPHTFAELDPVTASEILTDLISLDGNP